MEQDLKNFIVLSITDSTNNYANHLISAEPAVEGTAVLAYFQQKGRGQRENTWESAPGMNMLVSFILFPSFLPVTKLFYISKVTSLALIHWLAEKNIQATIKWPNDIYVGERKIAGILIETSVKGNSFDSALIGIGLNMNQTEFSPDIPRPVSMKSVTGKDYNVLDSASEFRDTLMRLYGLLKSERYDEIDEDYFSHLFRNNEWAMYKDGGSIMEARIIGIEEYGQLLLENRAGSILSYAFKEIEFVI